MERLGISTSSQTSNSTAPRVFTFVLSASNTGVCSVGQLMIVGLDTFTFNSYARYSNVTVMGNGDGSKFSEGECLIYENSSLGTPTITVEIEPISLGSPRNNLKVTITPPSSLTIKWSVYYENLSFVI